MKKFLIILSAVFALSTTSFNVDAKGVPTKTKSENSLPVARCSEHGYDWTKVINAIAQVESKGNPKAYNPRGNYAGLLQIGPILVKECNNIMKKKKSSVRYTLADRYDPVKSKQMFIIIQEKYNPTHNVEKAIRIWNGGPNYGVRSTQGYLEKVRKHLHK